MNLTVRSKRIIEKKSKAAQPETIGQARIFEKVKNKYLDHGLCFRCACQAAWGHQIGFNQSYPPCSECRLIVETFQTSRSNGWKSLTFRPSTIHNLRNY